MPTPVMSSVRGESYAEYVIKKSKFIARAVHITTEEEAQAYLRDGKKQYWDARHNCYAYQLGMNFEKQKSSDDGEPSGTAGKPILEVLKNKGLTNTLIVVTRYFGGIKLGTGGLIRAYGTAAVTALDNAIIEDYIDCRILYLQTDYSFLSATERLLPDFEAVITKRDFADFVSLTVEVPEDKADECLLALRDKTNGTLTVREKDKKIVPHIRPEQEVRFLFSYGIITAKTPPVFTLSPTATRTSVSVPSCGAGISFCIFMASNTRITEPRVTEPFSCLIAEIFPGMGALTTTAESGIGPLGAAWVADAAADAAGAGVGAGDAAATGAGAGVTGAAGAAVPNSSTSTSYDFPFTVTLNFFILSSTV